jgi:hypothetical protein
VCRNAPSVSHLLFADDSLILLRADLNNAVSLQQVLDSYCANSGQLVSVSKSSIFFSPNTDVDVKVQICNTLNINTEALSDKYLGLPALVGADRSDCFFAFCGESSTKNKGMEGKTPIYWSERDSLKSCNSINSSLCNVGVSVAKKYL